MKLQIKSDSIQLTLDRENTEEWGKGWPYSQFAGKEVEVMVNDIGIYSIFIDGEEKYDNVNYRELYAMVKDHVFHQLPPKHPCYEIISNAT